MGLCQTSNAMHMFQAHLISHHSHVGPMQVEAILFGSDKHSSNLYFDVQELGMEMAVRHYDRASCGSFGMSQEAYKELMRIFNRFKREADPLCNPAKKTSLIPIRVAATLVGAHLHPCLMVP